MINKHTFSHKRVHYLLIVCVCLVLTACASRHTDISQTQNVQNQNLEQLKKWSVRGKLAIITADERKSAYLSWQQKDETIDMALTTVIGSSIAKLEYDGSVATLYADDKSWQAESPSSLIYQVTGWEVPVEALSKWMKAQVDQTLVESRYDNGLVKQMQTQCGSCPNWQIDYKTYGQFELEQKQYSLPTSMNLLQAQSQTRLVLRIDDWRVNE